MQQPPNTRTIPLPACPICNADQNFLSWRRLVSHQGYELGIESDQSAPAPFFAGFTVQTHQTINALVCGRCGNIRLFINPAGSPTPYW